MFNEKLKERIRTLENQVEGLKSDVQHFRNQIGDIHKYLDVKYEVNSNYDADRFILKSTKSK